MKILAVLYKFGTMEEIGKNLGSYDYILNQLIEINKKGVEIIVLAPWVKWRARGSSNIEGIKIIRYWPKLAARSWRNLLFYKLINRFYIWQTGRLAVKYAEKFRADAVYVRQARETGYAVARVKPRLNVPIIFQPITTWRWHFEDVKVSFWKGLAKDTTTQKKYAEKILHDFDYFITYDRAMIDEYAGMGAERKKFYVIPPAVRHEFFKPVSDREPLRRELNLPVDKKLVINVSRINLEEKGQLYLLEAFRRVVNQHDDTRLIVIGPGTAEQTGALKNKIRELKLQNHVEYLGSKDYGILPKYMGACDLGVLPSIWFEAFGRTTIDMISCGLPMVTTTVGGMPEVNMNNVTGLLVDPKNVEQTAAAISKIISDDDLRMIMSKNARQRALAVYTFEKTTEKFIELFQKIAA